MRKSPLQRAEWKIFGLAISDARLRAARGELAAGYACLLAGLQRMEELVTGGDAWAGELLDAYRRATDEYTQHLPARPEVPVEIGERQGHSR